MGKDTSFSGKKSLVIREQLIDLSQPVVMGILNITPDSFYDGGMYQSDEAMLNRVHQLVDEGSDIIDIGAYSSRPGASPVSEDKEITRLEKALKLIRKNYPVALISVDTFRASVAERVVQDYGVGMINDISGGGMNAEMYGTIARLQVPYVLMHMQGTPQTMQKNPEYVQVIRDIMYFFSEKVARLRELGVHDIILDPGFGFGKTLEHNYQLLKGLRVFHRLDLPLMVGISRKSMIYKLLGVTPEEALAGTVAVHTLALTEGVDILRVHDVKAAREAIEIVGYWKKTKLPDMI